MAIPVNPQATSVNPYSKLLSPIYLGALSLRNRMVMGAMHTRLETLDRSLEREIAFYEERAKGGIGLIISGGFSPNQEGLMEPDALEMSGETDIGYQRELTQAVAAHDTPFFAQILHAGRYAKSPDCVAPSSIKSPIRRHVPRALKTDEVWNTIGDFARASDIARQCGYSGIEIMGSEGYLINQFLATRTNARNDEFGGSWSARKRFALEVVSAIRSAVGKDFPILFRLSVIELVEGGMSSSEIIDLAQALEQAGVDGLNSGAGWHESRVPTVAQVTPRAAFRKETASIKAVVNIPVMASNRINDPDVAESILQNGEADLISLSRPMLADPAFAQKVENNRTDLINTCIACNQSCLDRIFVHDTPSCLVNPRAGRELDYSVKPASASRRVAVVGGGAAGMTCAAEAAERGHKVTLFEQSDSLGGLINLAKAVPAKSEFDAFLRYMTARLDETGVDVLLNAHVTLKVLDNYDHVVIATGVVPRVPDISGVNHSMVVGYEAVLSGAVQVGKRVAILGAGGIGFDVAEFLLESDSPAPNRSSYASRYGLTGDADQPGGFDPALEVSPMVPREVTLLQRSEGRLGKTLSITTDWIKRATLGGARVAMISGASYKDITDKGLRIEVDGEESLLAVDTVVLCTGQLPNRQLADALAESKRSFEIIGGARKSNELDAAQAVEDALQVAINI